MKIHILSDIHNEFEVFHPPANDADVVILAGDVDVKGRSIDWIERMFPEKVVLFVLGNHEFYGEAIPRQIEKAKKEPEEQVSMYWKMSLSDSTILNFPVVPFGPTSCYSDNGQLRQVEFEMTVRPEVSKGE